jgi:hypothetical protein
MVPASPEDVDDVTRQVFLSRAFRGDEWQDWDVVLYDLGKSLEVFPESLSFLELKWVFVSF